MIVFIDDSGDAGFKLSQGSTEFFVIAMVIFDDELEAEKTAVSIKEFRRSLGWPDYREFRFYKLSKDLRLKFLNCVNPFRFRIRALVVDKKIVRSPELKSKKDKFYAYFIKEALKHSDGTIMRAKIKIDGSGDRVFRKNFLAYLRKELNTDERRIMIHCKLVDSSGNVLVQLADMIAGSINRSCSDKKDATMYKNVFQKHIEDEWEFQ